MRAPKWMAVLAMLILALPAAAKVSVDYDKSADFSEYKTYAWQAGTPAPNEIVQRRIEAGIDRELQTKGWRRVESGADINLVTHASVGKETRVTADSFGYGGYRGWRGWGGRWSTTTVNVSEIAIGTLLVDLVDAESKELVWRAVVSATVTNNPDKSEKKINKACKKMFKDFPPGQTE